MQRRPPLLPGGPSGAHGHGHGHGGMSGGGAKIPNSLQLDYERRRKVAIKCLELEEMLMSQGFSQQEIEAKVTSFRNLLLVRQATANAAAVHGAQGLQAVTNPAAAALAAITAAAQLASHHGSGHRGPGANHHHLAALRTSAAAASLATSVANVANAFTQKPSNAILNLRLNQQLHQQRLSNAILTGQVPSGSTYARGVLAHDVYAIRKREGSSESEHYYRGSGRKKRRHRKERDRRRHGSQGKSSHRHSRRHRRYSGHRGEDRNSKSSRYQRSSRSPHSRSRSRTPHSQPSNSRKSTKISPNEAGKYSNTAAYSTPMTSTNNLASSNCTKKRPTEQSNSKLIEKGLRNSQSDFIDSAKSHLPEGCSQNKDIKCLPTQDKRGKGETKGNNEDVGKINQKEKSEAISDDATKTRRQSPPVPIPSRATKEDAISRPKLGIISPAKSKDSELLASSKDSSTKPLQDTSQSGHFATTGTANQEQLDRQIHTKGSKNTKLKDRKKKKKKRTCNRSRRSRTRSRSRSISPHGRSGYRSEKKRRKNKRNRSRSHSNGRISRRSSSKTSRRSNGKKRSSKSRDDKVSKETEKKTELKESSTETESHVPGENEFTSDDSKKIVISSIDDIPVVGENSSNPNTSEQRLFDTNIKETIEEDIDDDAKALAEIEKEGEAYNARQKKKTNFSFEILSSKSARLRHIIQMNNSNKANNNGGVKDAIIDNNSLKNQPEKNSMNLGTISSNQDSATPSKKSGNNENLEQANDSPVPKQRQQKPERASRFGPSINNAENPSADLNLKFPKFLPKSNNSGGLLPTPDVKENPTNSKKYHSADGLKDVETDSLGRIRRKSHQRSQSRSRDSRSRSRSYSYSSCSRSRSRSHSRGHGRHSYSRSYSRSWSRSRSRSPSIPRRQGSPSFLDKRRITSARKRPIPYKRKTRFYYEDSPYCSTCSESSRSSWSGSRSRSPSCSRSYTRSPRSHSRSRSRSRSSYRSRHRSGGGVDLRNERWSSRSRSRSFSP